MFTWTSKFQSLNCCICWTIPVIRIKFAGYVARIVYSHTKSASNPCYRGWVTAFFLRDCSLLAHPGCSYLYIVVCAVLCTSPFLGISCWIKFCFVSVCSTCRRGMHTNCRGEGRGQSGYLSSAWQQRCCQSASGRTEQGLLTQQGRIWWWLWCVIASWQSVKQSVKTYMYAFVSCKQVRCLSRLWQAMWVGYGKLHWTVQPLICYWKCWHFVPVFVWYIGIGNTIEENSGIFFPNPYLLASINKEGHTGSKALLEHHSLLLNWGGIPAKVYRHFRIKTLR